MIFDIVPLGALLAVMGAGFGLLTVALLRVLQKAPPPQPPTPDLPPIPLEINRHQDAVLMIEPGGRVVYANPQALSWFGLEEPNLERYARRTRPSDAFLGVCASEGQARFSISGRIVEAISYLIPHPTLGKVMVVGMRRPQVAAIAAGSGVSGHTIEIFAELSQSMASSLDFEATLQAVLEGVEHLVPSDFTEITIWDSAKRHLVPYRFVGTASGERHMDVTDERYGPQDGYSGYLISQRQALLVPNVDAFRDVRPVIDRRRYPFRSYLGVPLVVGSELIGTLELAAVATEAFSETDLEVIKMISGQAAVALHNALLFQEEQRQSRELSGLAHLAQTAASIRNPDELFETLITSVQPLFDVEFLGVLSYDETRRRLVGKSPFIGLPENFLALYQVDIPPASEAERVLTQAGMITAFEPTANPDLIALGLHHVAQAAGMRQTLLAPLASSGRVLGYLQIANRSDGASFNDDDIRLLSIVAAQVGPVLENVNLLRESRQRAHRAETMRRVAALAASDATLDETLRFVLQDVARELQADAGVIRLLDDTGGVLMVHADSLVGLSLDELPHPHRIFTNSPRYQQMLTNRQQHLLLTSADQQEELGEVYRDILQALGMQSMLGVPLMVRQRGKGEIVLYAHSESAFDEQATLFLSTVAGQLSGAVERASLYGQTDTTLRRRVEELTALTHISRELNLTLDLDHILQRVLDEILRMLKVQHGSIVLFDIDAGGMVQYDRVAHHIGIDPAPWLKAVTQRARYLQEPLIIPNYQSSDLPYPMEKTQSALLAPVIHQEQVAGFIFLWSQQAQAFDDIAGETVQALAIQTAIALGNARRYLEQTRRNELLNRRMETVSKLLEAAKAQSLNHPLEEALEAIAYAIQEATPFNLVLISVYHPKGEYLERVAGAGFAIGELEELRNYTQPWKVVREYLQPEYLRGSSYFIPVERKPVEPPEAHVFYPSSMVVSSGDEEDAWQPDDMLLTPLYDAEGAPLGLISVDSPRNGLRPDWPAIETLELFATQAALTLESHLRLRALRQDLQLLQRRYERTRHLSQVGQRHLPFLLHKDVEQTLSLYQLSNHTRRIRAGLDIAAMVNQQADRDSVYRVLARELLLRMEMDVVLVAEHTPEGPALTHVVGGVPQEVNPHALFGQANPLRHALQSGETILVADINRQKDWRESALLRQLHAHAFIALPIRINQMRPDTAVLMMSQAPLPGFTPADEQLYALLGRQVALTLQNLQLLTETSHRLREVNLLLEFSRQLGGLQTASILRTLMDTAMQVVLSAESGQVLWWDSQQQVLRPRVVSGMVDEVQALAIVYPLENTLPGEVFQQGRVRRMPEVDFAQAYPLSPEGLLCYRDATGGRLPVSSMLIPIQSGDHKWGLLVLDNYTTSDAFSIEGQTLVHSLTQQAALALENARLYQSAEQKARQLQALTEAASALSANLEQSEGLVDSLLDHLSNVVPFDTATLWLRSGDTLTIRSARGFEDNDERVGISVQVEDSRLFQEMLLTSQPIVVGDVVQDERIPVWEAASYLSWLGIPLVSKGALTGVIALEKSERDFYSPEDVQIAATFATQAAIVLENAALLQESLRRARELDERSQRLALLNELSADLSASLDVDAILRVTIGELFRALSCSSASMVLFSPEKQQPVLWVEAPEVLPELPQALPDAPLFKRMREVQGAFQSEDIAQEEDLQPLWPYLEQHKTHALLAVPIASGEVVHGVLLAHESHATHRFTAEEIELARTISNQAAIALQNARLYEETQSRLNEISAIYQISQALTSTIDLDELLARLPEQLSAIVDTRNLYLALYDASHDLVSFPLAIEHGARLDVAPQPPCGLTGHILRTCQPLLLVGEGAAEALASLNSVQIGEVEAAAYLGVPLLVGDEAIGVLAVEDPVNPHAYTENDLHLMTTVAAQLAVAIQNSRLFTEASQRTNDLSLLFEFGTRIAYELDESRLVNITFDVLQHALQVQTLALVVEDDLGDLVGEILDQGERLSGIAVPRDGSSLSEYVLQKGETLLIRDMQGPEERIPVEGYDVGQPVRSWLGVPLVARGKTIGVLSIQDYQPERFTEQHALLLSQVAGQLATALDNARLFTQVQSYAEQLEHRVAERTQELAREHQRTETLLRIITELSASLDMDIVLNRTLTLINQIVGAEQSTIMLVDSGDDVLMRRASRGYTSPTPEGGHFTTIKSGEGLGGWVIKERKPALVADVTKDPRWVPNPDFPTSHRSAMAVPLMVGEEVLGTLMLFHREPDRFSEMHLDLVQATAKQIAVALNNAKLYRLVADQSERLGDMLRTQHVETTRSKAILEAVADGVLVTDLSGQITLFNASAERILNLPRESVLNQSLEHFSGMFGEAARSWMETIRTWSANPRAYSNEDVYAERIDLDNGRVVSVHLSPVLLRDEFLGTVSIFRDITHQVEVDRLKSEFVANVSHELRTPMTSIKGYVDIMLMGAAGKLSEPQTNFLQVVRSNTERMITLVNDLLNISQMETGRIELDIKPLDLRPILEQVVADMRNQAQKDAREMTLNLEVPQDLPLVRADADRAAQIVENLVDNAYHYTPSGGHIWVTAHREGDFLQVDVRDDGIGIPPEEQPRVFERFYRGEDVLVIETAGTGLGLSIVQNLVEMHGGKIWVQSEGVPGAGSTFSFTLPLAQPAPVDESGDSD